MSRFISFICETVCSCYGNMNAAELMRKIIPAVGRLIDRLIISITSAIEPNCRAADQYLGLLLARTKEMVQLLGGANATGIKDLFASLSPAPIGQRLAG